jgi:GNAT superfamily N-acetyltransferase
VEVRAAVASDVPELARLWREFGAYYAELDPERFKVPAGQPELESARWLVADDGGRIVGFAAGRIIRPHPEADLQPLTDAAATRLGIEAVFVAPEDRGQGIAAALIAALEEWARDEGAGVVLAESAFDSPLAVRFWDGADGYAPTSVRYRKRLR